MVYRSRLVVEEKSGVLCADEVRFQVMRCGGDYTDVGIFLSDHHNEPQYSNDISLGVVNKVVGQS